MARNRPEPIVHDVSAAYTATMSASSQASSAFTGGGAFIVCATQPAWYLTGAAPTAAADTTSVFLPANMDRVIKIDPGHKIAVIQGGTGGTFFCGRIDA